MSVLARAHRTYGAPRENSAMVSIHTPGLPLGTFEAPSTVAGKFMADIRYRRPLYDIDVFFLYVNQTKTGGVSLQRLR